MKYEVALAALAAALMACAAAAAPSPPSAHRPNTSHPASLEQAVKQVQDRTRGHILAADTMSRGHTEVYRIKVLKPDGKVEVMQLHSSPRTSARAGFRRPDRGGH